MQKNKTINTNRRQEKPLKIDATKTPKSWSGLANEAVKFLPSRLKKN